MASVPESVDRDVRVFVYGRFVDQGAPPTVEQVADELGLALEEAKASFRRLEAARALVFAPGTLRIWMANPLSAYPTPFRVATPRGAWWASCVWDAFGIPAMLGEDGVIETADQVTSEPFELRIEDGELQPAEAVAHFTVPASRWWENIGYT